MQENTCVAVFWGPQHGSPVNSGPSVSMATMASVQGLPSATPSRVAACFPRSGFLQCQRQHRRRARHHAAATVNAQPAGAALFELDGAVMDMHMDGHRVAFNRALASLGYEASGSACMQALCHAGPRVVRPCASLLSGRRCPRHVPAPLLMAVVRCVLWQVCAIHRAHLQRPAASWRRHTRVSTGWQELPSCMRSCMLGA